MLRSLLAGLLVIAAGCGAPSASQYLFLWAGDADGQASDFLAVIDANPASARYGSVVASLPTGVPGSHPHHTEDVMPASGHLLANGFHAGSTWLFDLTDPLHPRIDTVFGDVGGFSHPHSFSRLPNGNVLATFQYRADSGMAAHDADGAMDPPAEPHPGGLVEMDERGHLIRSASAADPALPPFAIYPYGALPLPKLDLALSTTTDMNEKNLKATSEWVQFWRWSDLTLLRSVRLPPGPRGDENLYTGEPRLLPDSQSVYVHTFNCGLYLLDGLREPAPRARLVWTFDGNNCGVPVLTGHYWIQTVPEAHALVVLDVSDPARPKEVARLPVGEDEQPHWLAIDPSGRRLVLNSGGGGIGNRLFVVNFDPATGAVAFDERFRDRDDPRPGIHLTGRQWPHGFSGTAVPHGTVFGAGATQLSRSP